MIEVVVDNGPLWLQYVVGFGTAGAALFAGWAALATSSAARESRRLVEIEQAREQLAHHEAKWRHVRRVVVDLVGQQIPLPDGRNAHDFHLTVLNAGSDPILKARIKVVMGDGQWGPQLIGNIAPNKTIAVTARIITDADDINANGFVRFLDTEGRAWIVAAKDPAREDNAPVDRWIEEGRANARRPMTPEERGTTHGVNQVPDFDAWRDRVASGEPWDGENDDV